MQVKHTECFTKKYIFCCQSIFSQYIVAGAPYNLHCNLDVRTSIHDHLLPPFEDLFDPAEEFVLEMLFDAWSQMIMCDLSTFDKVCLSNIS